MTLICSTIYSTPETQTGCKWLLHLPERCAAPHRPECPQSGVLRSGSGRERGGGGSGPVNGTQRGTAPDRSLQWEAFGNGAKIADMLADKLVNYGERRWRPGRREARSGFTGSGRRSDPLYGAQCGRTDKNHPVISESRTNQI